MEYLIEDTNKIVSEKELRTILMQEETTDILNNIDDYMDGALLLENQFHCIKTAKNGDIMEVIDLLGTNWNIPVKVLDKKSYNSVLVLDPKIPLDDYLAIKEQIEKRTDSPLFTEIGIRKLAYETKGHLEGFYLEIEFKSITEKIAELEDFFKNNSNILKYLVMQKEEYI